MRKSPVFLPLLLAICLAGAAHAKTAYLVQLGSASTSGEAASQWQKLQADYPALLEGLSFTPRTLTSLDGKTSETRIEAGPLPSHARAERLCSELAAKKVSCYIVETAEVDGAPVFPPAPLQSAPIAMAEATPVEASEPMETAPPPVAEASAPVAAPMEKAEAPSPPPPPPSSTQPAAAVKHIALPWLKQAPTEHVREELSEAVRVPVTETPPEAPPAAAITESAPAPVAVAEAPVPAPVTESRGWVRIIGFVSEQRAYDFSEMLRRRIRNLRGIHVRITRPLSFGKEPVRATSLALGPVSGSMAARICEVAGAYAELRCERSGEQWSKPQETPRTISYSRPRITTYVSAAARSVFAGNPPSRYWVQLGTWRSRGEAEHVFASLKREHSRLLRRYPPSITAPRERSLDARAGMRLRVGPFNGRREAERLCSALAGEGARCIVVPE